MAMLPRRPVVNGDELSTYWPAAAEAAVLTNYTLGLERRSAIIQVMPDPASTARLRFKAISGALR